jgi:hypothetical protein
MRTTRMVWVGLVAAISLSCGSGSDPVPEPDFGQHALASLDEACEGIPGLTGQAVLDQRVDFVSQYLYYVTASGDTVSPTALRIELTWPAAPVAVCYPAYADEGVSTGPRVAIAGVAMRFTTTDGKFAEELAAKAWIFSSSGAASVTAVMAARSRDALTGTWVPFANYDNGGATLTFVKPISGVYSTRGNVGLSNTSLAEAGAGIVRSGNAVAVLSDY